MQKQRTLVVKFSHTSLIRSEVGAPTASETLQVSVDLGAASYYYTIDSLYHLPFFPLLVFTSGDT